jgi:hypothetical protein
VTLTNKRSRERGTRQSRGITMSMYNHSFIIPTQPTTEPSRTHICAHTYMHAAHHQANDHLSITQHLPSSQLTHVCCCCCCCCQLYVVNQAGFTKQHIRTESFHHCTDLLYPAHICTVFHITSIHNLPLHIRTECVSTAIACCTVPANIS